MTSLVWGRLKLVIFFLEMFLNVEKFLDKEAILFIIFLALI